MASSKAEPSIRFGPLTKNHVKAAVCQDPANCTIALPLAAALEEFYGERFIRDSLNVGYVDDGEIDDSDTDFVTAAFDAWDSGLEILRHHTATVTPKKLAWKLYFRTDTDKPTLLKQLKPGVAHTLTLEDHTSRPKQARYAPVDQTTPEYAYNKGYREGRSPVPSTERGRQERQRIINNFTPEQVDAYSDGFQKGVTSPAGPLPRKRTPRSSAKTPAPKRVALISASEGSN